MKLSAILAPMIAAGVSGEVILATVRAYEDERVDALEKRRESDRKRQAAKADRDRQSRESREPYTAVSSHVGVTRVEDISSTNKITGKEESKEERAPSAAPKRAHRLPADWVLPDAWRAEAIAAGVPPGRVQIEADKMRNWSLSAKNGAKLDWHASWRNWFQEAIDRSAKGIGPPPSRAPRNPGERALVKLQGQNHEPPDPPQGYDPIGIGNGQAPSSRLIGDFTGPTLVFGRTG